MKTYNDIEQICADAFMIAEGACNPIAVSASLSGMIEWIGKNRSFDEARSNAAVKLTLHQLAFLCGVPTNEGLLEWDEWRTYCKLNGGRILKSYLQATGETL